MRTLYALLFAITMVFTFTAAVAGETTSGSADVSYIMLNGNSIALDGSGAAVDGSMITITSAGTYSISGSLDDGQIRIDSTDAENVNLILNGANIACSTSAPIYILSAEKTVINLADGTSNSVTDGTAYVLPDADSDEPNAVIFSKDDLTIKGSGTLTVDANYNDGITSKDDLKITGGSITVQAVNDGIRGRDSVEIKGGSITVNAAGDGIQSNNDEDAEKGYISIEDGTLNIIAGADGIQAETSLAISGGDITVKSGGGSSAVSTQNTGGGRGMETIVTGTDDDSDSAKGLKAGAAVIITGGTLDINSADDAIHSNDAITISGGESALASSDDAIHADSTLEINGGDITIARCYEGLDSAAITINGGDIHLVASDDGVNAVTKGAGSEMMGGPGQNTFAATGSNSLAINGGYLVVNAGGDGLDINGPITMTDGTVIINGPTNSGNGPIDYLGSFTISGGDFLAVGSAGMAMAPSTSSTQNSVMLTYSASQAAGTLVHIESDEGEDILTFAPAKTYQSVVFSSSALARGSGYVVYSGGRSTGTVQDGLYSGGTYTPGTEVTSFTISGTVTTVGSQNGQMPANMPGNRTVNMPGNIPGSMAGNGTKTVPGNVPGGANSYTPGATSWNTTRTVQWNAAATIDRYIRENAQGSMSYYIRGNTAGGMNSGISGYSAAGMTAFLPGGAAGNQTGFPPAAPAGGMNSIAQGPTPSSGLAKNSLIAAGYRRFR